MPKFSSLRKILCGFLLTVLGAAAALPARAGESRRCPSALPPNEMPATEVRRTLSAAWLKSHDYAFLYVNESCTPLSIEAKLAEQGGQIYRAFLENELIGLRENPLGQWARQGILAHYMSEPQLAQALHALASPLSIGLKAHDLEELHHHVEALEREIFGRVSSDTQGDAFRHYVGNALLMKHWGLAVTRKITAWHEVDDLSLGSLMDRFNNQLAQRDVQEILQKNPGATEAEFTARALQLIANQKLVYLRSLNSGEAHSYKDQTDFVAWANQALNYRLY